MVAHIFNPSGRIKIFKHSGGKSRWISMSSRTAYIGRPCSKTERFFTVLDSGKHKFKAPRNSVFGKGLYSGLKMATLGEPIHPV